MKKLYKVKALTDFYDPMIQDDRKKGTAFDVIGSKREEFINRGLVKDYVEEVFETPKVEELIEEVKEEKVEYIKGKKYYNAKNKYGKFVQ